MYSGRLIQYFGAATVKAESAYIGETNGTESFISSHFGLGRVVARILTLFDRFRYIKSHFDYLLKL